MGRLPPRMAQASPRVGRGSSLPFRVEQASSLPFRVAQVSSLHLCACREASYSIRYAVHGSVCRMPPGVSTGVSCRPQTFTTLAPAGSGCAKDL